ncbi:MAG: ACP S-malonyltransferase, partial [Acidobacteriota bacterium]
VGAMAAILGLDVETIEAGCTQAAQGQICSPANINSPSQVVIAGKSEAVDRACEILKEKGAKRAIKLNVSAPFHCALMMPAQERLASDLNGLEYGEFAFPILHNIDAVVNCTVAVVAERLTQQVSSPVRWLQTIENMAASGVDKFIEIGPGKVLTGLVRQINRDAVYANIENTEGLRNTLETL